MRSLGHGRDGRILIGAPKAAIIEFLACDLAALQAKYPEITLQMQEENSKIVQQLLRDRVIDIGIFEKTSGFIDLPQADYGRDRLVLVYSRAHFEFTSSALPLDAVLSCPLVTLGQGSAILATLQRAYQSRGRVFHANYTVSGFDTMLAVVRQGLGVGLMPPAIFESFQPEAALGAVALEGNWHERRYVLSFVEGQAQEQTLRNVVAELLHRI